MNPALIKPLIVALCIALLIAGSGFEGYKLGKDHEIAAHAEDVQKVQEALNAANDRANDMSKGYEQVVAYMDSQQKLTERKWRSELNKPVYSACKPDNDGLLQLNEQINAINNSRKPNGTLSRDSSTGIRVNDGRSDASAQKFGFGLW